MDSDLITRAQRGDQRAFEMLVAESHRRLQRVAVGILRDPHLAEDAVQQAFVNIWRDLRRLRDPAKFEGWSYRLVVRACYAEARRRPTGVPDSELRPTQEPLAPDEYGPVLHRDQLERAFDQLSLDHRAVVVLHHLMDMTLDQVADALDLRLGTVKSRLNRAMHSLRDVMEADAPVASPEPIRQEAVR
jgi:RNA polymerase sigma-70 factor (ECF subfamily)